jgi:hypothetical protein
MDIHTTKSTDQKTKQSTLFPTEKQHINSIIGVFNAEGPVDMKKYL